MGVDFKVLLIFNALCRHNQNSMKKFNSISLIIILIGFTIVNSCKKEESTQQSNEPAFVKNFGASVEKDFLIEVIDDEGSPLANTDILIGNFSGKTDVNGILQKKGVKVYEKYAFIKASKLGYISGGRSLIPGQGTNKVTIQLMQGYHAGTVSSGKSGIVTLSNGTKVEFDGEFEDVNGNAYSGDVKVYMKLLSSSDKDIGTKMPGMLYGEREDGSESILETYGMISVDLFGSSNQIIQPAKGHKAKITFPIDLSQTANAPSKIPLWHFDEKYGYWIEEGSASRTGNEYKGEVSHFTWWNADMPWIPLAINITVTDMNSKPLIGIPITLVIKGTNRSLGTDYTDDNGNISVLIPEGELFSLIIKNVCGDELHNQSIGPYTDATALPVIKLNYDKSFTLKGSLKNCKGEEVKNGYVIFKEAASNPKYFPITNGEINEGIPYCKLGKYTVRGFDNTNFMTSTPFEGTLRSPISDFGNITVCDSFGEYISYSIDGKTPSKILTSLIECYDKADGFEISAKHGQDYFKLNSNTKESVLHSHLNMNFSAADISYNQTSGMDIIFILRYGKSKGDFVDIEISGFYRDSGDNSYHEIKGTVHVRRDN